MKQADFKKAIFSFIKDKVGRFEWSLTHNNEDIYLAVRHPTGSSNSLETAMIYCVYIDSVKNRVFYVGKSEELRKGILFKKKPLALKYNSFKKWVTSSDKYDNYDVYFAWNYESKNGDLFNYIPLTSKIDAHPDIPNLNTLVFFTESDMSAYKLRAKNLHEHILKCYETN